MEWMQRDWFVTVTEKNDPQNILERVQRSVITRAIRNCRTPDLLAEVEHFFI